MPPACLVDTDVLIRYFTRDDEAKAARALALLQRAERAELRLVVSPIVVFETVFTLHPAGSPVFQGGEECGHQPRRHALNPLV